MEYGESSAPSKAEIVAGVVSKTATTDSRSLARTISYRVPAYALAAIDAMAAEAGKSRNAMLNLVVDAGIEAVYRELPKKVARSIDRRHAEALASLSDAESLEE